MSLKDVRTDIVQDLKDLVPYFGDNDPLVKLYIRLLYIDNEDLVLDCTTAYYSEQDIEGLLILVESTQ